MRDAAEKISNTCVALEKQGKSCCAMLCYWPLLTGVRLPAILPTDVCASLCRGKAPVSIHKVVNAAQQVKQVNVLRQ